MRTTTHRLRPRPGVCPRVRTLALSMLASRASSTNLPTEASVDAAVRGACARGLLATAKSVDDHLPLGFFYDLDAFEANMASLRHAFPPHWHHATAVKTNPLSALLRLTRDAGHGAECASIGEVQHVLRQGFAPDVVVYDSPCKTEAEIRFALERGVHLNADNLQELERVRVCLQDLQDLPAGGGGGGGGARGASVIGLRINPLVGAGAVGLLSVSTRKSKFGVVLPPEQGAEREAVVAALTAAEFVTCVHVHTGSGGMTLGQMAQGAAAAAALAAEVNARRAAAGVASRIHVLDVGGGLPVSWGSGTQRPSWDDYSAALREGAPELFRPAAFTRVVTEFGAAMHCKFGFLASRVEITKPTDGGGQIAMIHAGSDLFLRACYAPHMRGAFPVTAYTAEGGRKRGEGEGEGGTVRVVTQDIAGPLYFAGDVVVPAVSLPRLEPGDVVALHEAGGIQHPLPLHGALLAPPPPPYTATAPPPPAPTRRQTRGACATGWPSRC